MKRSLFLLILGPCLFSQEKIVIEANDLMQFKPASVEVKAGQMLEVELLNKARLPQFSNNWVLLKAGVDVSKFGNEAISDPQSGYLPERLKGQVIAFIPLVAPGKSGSVRFQAPTKGIYTFLCTYPGRYSVMQGKLIVQ